MDHWIILHHFVVGLRSNVNYCNTLRFKLGAYDNQIRHGKLRIQMIEGNILKITQNRKILGRREICKYRHNYLIGKDEKLGSKYKSEKSKITRTSILVQSNE